MSGNPPDFATRLCWQHGELPLWNLYENLACFSSGCQRSSGQAFLFGAHLAGVEEATTTSGSPLNRYSVASIDTEEVASTQICFRMLWLK